MTDVKINLITNLIDKGTDELADQLKKAEGIFSKVGEVGLGAGVAVGGAIAGATVQAINFADEVNEALTLLDKQVNASDEELAAYKKTATEIFAGPPPVGDSIRDVTEALGQTKNITDLAGEALDNATKDALNLAGTFDKDVNEVLRAADSLVRNNVATSFDEAFDLIAKGFTEGGDRADDLLDTLNEYAQDFGELGFTAQDTFRFLNDGLEAGAFNTDKLADALNEFGINLQDQAKIDAISEIKDNLFALGEETGNFESFNTVSNFIDRTIENFNKGVISGQDALDLILTGLGELEDPLLANQIGVELFGSMWEDMGSEAIMALGGIEDGMLNSQKTIDEVSGSMDELADKPQSLQQLWESAWRNINIAIEPLGQELIPLISEGLLDFIELIQTDDFRTLAKELGTDLAEAINTSIDALGRISEALGLTEEDATSAEKAIGGFITIMGGIGDVIDLFARAAEQAGALADQISTIKDLVSSGEGDLLGGFLGANASTGAFSINPGEILANQAAGFFGLPTFHEGGIVPGPRGANVPIMAQAGEMVIPNGGTGMGITINVNAPVFGVDDLDRKIDEAGQRIIDQLRVHFN